MAVGVLNNAFRQSSSLQLNPLEKSLPVPQGNNANEPVSYSHLTLPTNREV